MKISQHCYAERRRRLLEMLPEGSVALVAGASLATRNRDAEYAFRQHSDFYYLTGFNEPDAILLLRPGRDAGQVVLFCPPRDPAMEIWTGYRAGPEGCVERFGADQAFDLSELETQMPQLLDGARKLYYALGSDDALDSRVRGWLNAVRAKERQGAEAPQELILLDNMLHEMRLLKDEEEVQIMRRAAQISAEAHCEAMRRAAPGAFEYQLEGTILSYCMDRGARFQAYSPIVGGGENACILHYIDNDAPLHDGDLVLIDAGCELDCYASDITRTFPVNGRFSPEQRALYELVLNTNQACIELIRPGLPWNEVHDLSVRLLTGGLIELGLLEGELDQLIESGAYKEFYMHRIGHWLGMDVHDVGNYKVDGEWRPLAPGMVMTVEPGLYVSPQNEKVEARWRGIGIRIEDDVLVTAQGAEVLTAAVPKRVDEIEALMAQSKNPVGN
ncbi:Xaa-Pro aminopeptidase [Marinobacterium zhoushanense]|uniref:Xaa-Pro aminopeptidase n=1 Tax=Marinobacterium zhoushanense TaxID=1679163 RepID=A0ABQ1KSJ9_9GAMM|nr:Xaa-Pro aminopeptidase [Marinobacterium zhoushanense]GGC09670.1 Xaa-Pro aminopeptidase [Marinobacterium zhoushanense]